MTAARFYGSRGASTASRATATAANAPVEQFRKHSRLGHRISVPSQPACREPEVGRREGAREDGKHITARERQRAAKVAAPRGARTIDNVMIGRSMSGMQQSASHSESRVEQ